MQSAPILDAEYGDCGCSGCFSSIGVYCAVPYVSEVDVCTMRGTSRSRTASSMFRVPLTFTDTYDAGAVYEYGIAMSAARWNTVSLPATMRRAYPGSVMSPCTMSSSPRTEG